MIGFTIASIGGTAYLWYTYFDIKQGLDKAEQTEKYSILVESVRNETAFFWYSIVATIVTVSIIYVYEKFKILPMIKRENYLLINALDKDPKNSNKVHMCSICVVCDWSKNTVGVK